MDRVKKAEKIYNEDGWLKLSKSILVHIYKRTSRFFKSKHYRIMSICYSITDRYGITDPEKVYSEAYYEKRTQDPRRSDARQVGKVLDDLYSPDSVIDFGCAIGHYLEIFYEHDKVVYGIEGNENALKYAVIPKKYIEIFDLRHLYDPSRKYDMAICFELAEHLAENHAETLVSSVTSSADVIIFTAAPPGQGGQHHVNEKPRSYWINKFENAGFYYDEEDTHLIQDQLSLQQVTEISENLFVFKKDADTPREQYTV